MITWQMVVDSRSKPLMSLMSESLSSKYKLVSFISLRLSKRSASALASEIRTPKRPCRRLMKSAGSLSINEMNSDA